MRQKTSRIISGCPSYIQRWLSQMRQRLHARPSIGEWLQAQLKPVGVGLAAVAIAVVLSVVFRVLTQRVPTLFFLAAVFFSSWYGGIKSGLIATGLSALGISYFLLLPQASLALTSINDILILTAFIAVALFASAINNSRKQAEADLRASEERFSLLVGSIEDCAIFVLDPDGRVASWNQRAQNLYGYKAKEILGQPIARFYPATDLDQNRVERSLQIAGAEGKVATEGWRVRQDNSQFWASDTITALKDSSCQLKGFSQVIRDLTPQKAAAAQLQKSLQELAELNSALNASAIVLKIDAEGKINYANERYCEISQYSCEELLGRTYLSILDTSYHPAEFWQSLQVTVTNGDMWHGEISSKAKDGSNYWLDATVVPLLEDSGRFWQYLVICADITERKQVEAEIVIRARQQEAIAHLSQQALQKIDLDQLLAATASSIAQTLEVEYCQIWELLPDSQTLHLRAAAGARGGVQVSIPLESNSWENRILAAAAVVEIGNPPFPALLESLPSISGLAASIPAKEQPFGLIGAYTAAPRQFNSEDVSFFQAAANILSEAIARQRVEAERAQLLEREQAARTIAESAAEQIHHLQSISDAVIDFGTSTASAPQSLDSLLETLLDRITGALDVDTAAILLADAGASSLLVKAAKGLEAEVSSQVRIPIGQGFAGKIAQTRQPWSIERDAYKIAFSSILQNKGIESLLGVPLAIADRVLGVIHVGSLTSRQFSQGEIELLQLAARRIALAVDRAYVYEAEQKARHQAEVANRLKDEFLAIVSHELRTPLNSILGWAQMLRTRKLNQGLIDKALETIERNAKQQVKLIEDILDVSRIIRGKIRLHLRPVNLEPIIQESIDSVMPLAEAKNLPIETVLPQQMLKISGDRDRLHQIIWNLLANAIKFTPSGGSITVRLSLEVQGGREYVQVAVSDTGMGIAPEFLPHVFEGFRQADSSITREQGGLGLGLTITRYLVEMHGGNISAASPGRDKGATFTVQLPLAPAAVPLATANPGTSETGSSNFWALDGLEVLVVDDDADTCELISTILAQYGVRVTTATSASQAIATLEQVRPQILVSDLGMPGEDGYALIRKVRQLDDRRGGKTPAIALTAFAREEDRQQAIQAGFQMHVSKPVEPDRLAAVLASLAGYKYK